MVYGIVQRHGAEIDVESEFGHGTTMRLTFAAPNASGDNVVRHLAQSPRPPRLRILIVDDDPLLLNSLRDVLERDGHLVTAANGGDLGISLFRQAHHQGQSFRVVDRVVRRH